MPAKLSEEDAKKKRRGLFGPLFREKMEEIIQCMQDRYEEMFEEAEIEVTERRDSYTRELALNAEIKALQGEVIAGYMSEHPGVSRGDAIGALRESGELPEKGASLEERQEFFQAHSQSGEEQAPEMDR